MFLDIANCFLSLGNHKKQLLNLSSAQRTTKNINKKGAVEQQPLKTPYKGLVEWGILDRASEEEINTLTVARHKLQALFFAWTTMA